MPIPTISFQNNLKIAQIANALYGSVVGATTNAAVLADIASVGYNATVNSYYTYTFGAMTTTQVAAVMVANLGITGAGVATATDYIKSHLAAAPGAEGVAVTAMLAAFSGLTADATFGAAATAWNTTIANAQAYTASGATADVPVASATIGTTFALTTGVENMLGTAGADTYNAYILNNSNTLQSGDVIDGGAGTDTLFAQLGNSANFAVSARTSNIENVTIQAQAVAVDSNDNNQYSSTAVFNGGHSVSQVDAQYMSGVNQWTDDGSRADVIIEDVRIGTAQITKDITITMANTDPGNVDYGVYFNQLSLKNTSAASSVLNINVMDTGAAATAATAATPLLNNPYDTFKFTATAAGASSGNVISLALPNAAAADTYAALLTAFQTALTNAGLTAVTASLGSNFTVTDPLSGASVTGQAITLTSTGGYTISTPTGSGWYNTTGASVPASSNIYTTYNTSTSSSAAMVTSTVILDNVGMGSTGGDLVIGGMSVGDTSQSRGVERFEITVKDNSKLQTINSTNNALREVTIVNGTTDVSSTAYVTYATNAGNLTVNGNANTASSGTIINTVDDTILPGVNSGNSTLNAYTADHHGTAGFTDVRLIDASTMTGQLAFTAAVTADSIAKYINLVDTAASATGDVAGTGNVNFSATAPNNGANFIYTGGTNNDTMVVKIDGGVAGSRSTVVSGQSDFTFAIDGGAGNDTITVNVTNDTTRTGGIQNWANNQDLNNNITITGGAGNDTINKPGAGDTTIDAGAGDDVVYTDNTGAQAGLTIPVGTAVGIAGAAGTGSSSNAIWVFNTIDQVNAVANGAARNISNLRSDTNNSWNLYNAKVVVSFKGIPNAATVTLANSSTYKATDLEINQAIKNCINNDATLSKLLVAQDGPGNTLVVKSLIDGTMTAATDLLVTITVPTTALSGSDLTGAAAAYGLAAGSDSATTIAAMTTSLGLFNTRGDYVKQFATDNVGVDIVGNNSTAVTDNFVSPGTGNDVIVLGTCVGQDTPRSSNDVITIAAGFGNDYIVNFAATGNGQDHISLASMLGGAPAGVVGALANTDKNITIIAEVAGTGATANNTAAQIKTLVDALANTASSKKQVYIAYDTNNVGKVYSVVDGTGAADSVVTLEGSIDLADTGWATLTVANFTVPSTTAEGSSSSTLGPVQVATVNNQVLIGTTSIDQLSTGAATGVTMMGLAGNDVFTVSAAGAVIGDLATGDQFNVTAGGVLTTGATVAAFVATAATSNDGTVTLTSLAAGSTINMAAATGTVGYTFVGGAGVDTLTGSNFADTIDGKGGADVISAGAGNDTINFTVATAGTSVATGTGNDYVFLDGLAAEVVTISDLTTGDAFRINADGTASTITANGVSAFVASAATVNADTTVGAVTLNAAATASTIDMTLATGMFSIVGGAGADTLTGGAGADVITGGVGIDTINVGAVGTVDTVVLTAVITAADRDVITNFTSGVDKTTLGLANTTVATGAGAAVVTADTTGAGVGGGAYGMTGATTGNCDVVLLNTTGAVTAAGANSGTLANATDGTELLKALTTAAAADTYTGITAAAASQKVYLSANQGGTSYVYFASDANGDSLIVASEIILVGTFSGTAAMVAADFQLA